MTGPCSLKGNEKTWNAKTECSHAKSHFWIDPCVSLSYRVKWNLLFNCWSNENVPRTTFHLEETTQCLLFFFFKNLLFVEGNKLQTVKHRVREGKEVRNLNSWNRYKGVKLRKEHVIIKRNERILRRMVPCYPGHPDYPDFRHSETAASFFYFYNVTKTQQYRFSSLFPCLSSGSLLFISTIARHLSSCSKKSPSI